MSLPVHIGRLRHRLTIQANTPTYASTGTTASWAAIADTRSDAGQVWGAVEALTGNEAILAHQVDSRATYGITLRYNGTITPKHRIVWGSRVFRPTRVQDRDERKILMRIEAWEEVV